MTNVEQIFDELTEALNLNKNQMAKIMGESNQLIHSWISRNSISRKGIRKLSDQFNIREGYLRSGEPPIFKTTKKGLNDSYHLSAAIIDAIPLHSEDILKIPVISKGQIAIPIVDKSMEPKLFIGDWVIVFENKNLVFRKNEIYCLILKDNPIRKVGIIEGIIDNIVTVKPINEKYPAEKIEINQIVEAYERVGFIKYD